MLDSRGGKGPSPKMVFLKSLTNHLECGHSVFLENFYDGIDSAEDLLNHLTYCTGPQNDKRVGIPKKIKETRAIIQFHRTIQLRIKIKKGQQKKLDIRYS